MTPPAEAVDPAQDRGPGSRRRRRWFLGISALLVAVALFLFRDVLLPFLLGLVVAYVLAPLVNAGERLSLGRWRVPRWAAVLLLYTMLLGLMAGLVFGALDVALMLPMDFPDKKTALAGAFLSRFAIGFLIPLVKLPMPPWAIGAIVGLLVSLPDAVITKAYVPILATGVVGGMIVGWAAGRFAA